ncbi:hypothetical protein U1Q18_052157 [Sarracenia purpurea var. burkii]
MAVVHFTFFPLIIHPRRCVYNVIVFLFPPPSRRRPAAACTPLQSTSLRLSPTTSSAVLLRAEPRRDASFRLSFAVRRSPFAVCRSSSVTRQNQIAVASSRWSLRRAKNKSTMRGETRRRDKGEKHLLGIRSRRLPKYDQSQSVQFRTQDSGRMPVSAASANYDRCNAACSL